jgi:hypothetical protein
MKHLASRHFERGLSQFSDRLPALHHRRQSQEQGPLGNYSVVSEPRLPIGGD